MLLPRRLRLLLLAFLVCSVGLVSQPTAANAALHHRHHHHRHHHRAGAAGRVGTALRIAMAKRGDAYVYGAAGPNRFDCSGLVFFSTHRAGFGHVPRTAAAQSHFMRHIRRSAMRPGDFVFFTGGGGVYHVGIYLGHRNGRRIILHAPRPGQRVKIEPIWTNAWFPGTLRR